MPSYKIRRPLLVNPVYKDVWIPATMFQATDPNQFMAANGAMVTVSGSTPAARPFAGGFYTTGSTIPIPTLSASNAGATNATAGVTFLAPTDAATTGSVAVTLFYTTKLAMATTGSIQSWRLHYDYLGTSGSMGLDSGSSLTHAAMVTTGLGKMEVQSLGNIPSFNASTSPFCAIGLTLEGSNACSQCITSSGSPEESIFGMRLRYQSTSLGITV